MKNSENNNTQEWVGSFYTVLHNLAVIQYFQLFNRHSFVNTVHLFLCWKMLTKSYCLMEKTPSGNLKVCSQSSSTLKPPLGKPTEFSTIETSKEGEKNLGRPLSCSEAFNDVNLSDLNCFVKNLVCKPNQIYFKYKFVLRLCLKCLLLL